MAMLVNRSTPLNEAEYFVFDLEVVGGSTDTNNILRPSHCYIWDMAFVHCNSNISFKTLVNPKLPSYPLPATNELFHVTEKYLEEQKAPTFAEVIPKFLDYVNYFTGGVKPAVFIAHGTFILDKPVLQQEFGRNSQLMPSNYYFYDTLPMFRQKFRRQASYSLKALYKHCFSEFPKEQHLALPDTLNLCKLVMYVCQNDITAIEGCVCPAYLTPLQTIKFIGRQKEQLMFNSGITCVEELVIICAKQCGFNELLMSNFLQQVCAVERSSAMKVARQVLFKVLTQPI